MGERKIEFDTSKPEIFGRVSYREGVEGWNFKAGIRMLGWKGKRRGGGVSRVRVLKSCYY